MIAKDTAVCLRKVDYSETSQVVTFFTRLNGKVGVMAKGSRRPKSKSGGPIEVLSYGQMIFYPSETAKLATLKEFDQVPIFIGLRRNLFIMNCALFGTELMDHFTHDHDPHPELFDRFIQYLTDVQTAADNAEAISLLILFQLTVMSEFGSALVLNRCVNCSSAWTDSTRNIYFSSTANGLICHDCEAAFTDKLRLNSAVADCLTDLRNLKNAPARLLQGVEKVLIYHLTEILHKRPRMAKYFTTSLSQ